MTTAQDGRPANHTNSPASRLWHLVRARPRIGIACLAGALGFLLLPSTLQASTRALITWDIGAGAYLVLAWAVIGRATLEHMRWSARLQDDGATAMLLLTVTAAVASLAAIVLELSGLKTYPATRQSLLVGLVVITFMASWLLVHTSFALHYAHAYYVSLDKLHEGPLEFPRQETPVYMDFLYFSMVVGMTCQTADVGIANTRMRRLVMAHGLVAFVFNTTLLALTINIVASLLG
ncbi:MAG: DUF1345 domain-containing protein [Sulfuritalea sp.]|nr:DUF1345 domain-containing protein [Sulfuritalea sp.]